VQPVVLVGSEHEENLSIRYLAAMVEGYGPDGFAFDALPIEVL